MSKRADDAMTGEETGNAGQLRLDLVQEGTTGTPALMCQQPTCRTLRSNNLLRVNSRYVRNFIPCTSAELWRKQHLDHLRLKQGASTVTAPLPATKQGDKSLNSSKVTFSPGFTTVTSQALSMSPQTHAYSSNQRLKSSLKDRQQVTNEQASLGVPRLEGVRIDSTGPAEVIVSRQEAAEMSSALKSMSTNGLAINSAQPTTAPLSSIRGTCQPQKCVERSILMVKTLRSQRLCKGSTTATHARPRTVPLSQPAKEILAQQEDMPHPQPTAPNRRRPFTTPRILTHSTIVTSNSNGITLNAHNSTGGSEHASNPPVPPASILSQYPPPLVTAITMTRQQEIVLNPRMRQPPSRPASQFRTYRPQPESITGLVGKRASLVTNKKLENGLLLRSQTLHLSNTEQESKSDNQPVDLPSIQPSSVSTDLPTLHQTAAHGNSVDLPIIIQPTASPQKDGRIDLPTFQQTSNQQTDQNHATDNTQS